ncbi:hypothetical protein LTR10_002954 [Elasticomyces elasticus]|nr:hypothetical protein LTR10_002954 [Elasticomyces elasticus]KAK4967709.1 hypothetical protein LTR42_010034 [Elasticomyces elasticus]
MGNATDQGWQVAILKKSRDGAPESNQSPTPQPTNQLETESTPAIPTSTSSPSPDVFFSKLPIEMRDRVYFFLADVIISVLFNEEPDHPNQDTVTRESIGAAQSVYIGCVLACKQMNDEFERAWIRHGSWASYADDCLDGPRNKLPTDPRHRRTHRGMRDWTLKGKLSGPVNRLGIDDYDYSLNLMFDKEHKLGYEKVWWKREPQAFVLAHLREDHAEYEEMQRLVEYIIVETVAERRAQDGCCGLTHDGAAQVFDAFGIQSEE